METKKLFVIVKMLLAQNGNLSLKAGSRMAGVNYENFSRKLMTGTLRVSELVPFLNALGYKLIIERDNERIEVK